VIRSEAQKKFTIWASAKLMASLKVIAMLMLLLKPGMEEMFMLMMWGYSTSTAKIDGTASNLQYNQSESEYPL
jgi:hypothetical protein